MVDMKATYLGLKLNNPLVAAACPFSESVESVQKLEQAGISAVVMYSLFEEQVQRQSQELDKFLNEGTESFAEALSYLPDLGRYAVGPETYVEHIQRVKKAVKIPIIGSLNGVSSGGWIEYAKKIEDAGADALELNLYYLPTDFNFTSSMIEEEYVSLVGDICQRVKIPVAVKLSPFFTALPNIARRIVNAGARGLVLFNRFYQPDFDLEEREVVPNLLLSTTQDLRLPLRWIAILYGQLKTDLALTSGVHTAQDAIKAVMAGASAVMLASVILKYGPERATKILNDMQDWLKTKEYSAVAQAKGSMSQGAVKDPAAFERAHYIKTLGSYVPHY